MTRKLLSGAVVWLVACEPQLTSEDWLVTEPRVLAVAGQPAEAGVGVPITYTALVASPSSSDAAGTLIWRFCLSPKPLAENNVVSPACLDASTLTPAGIGEAPVARTPSDACALFGPNTQKGDFRPRDPDASGGYYQPLRVDLPGSLPVFHLQRLQCGLAGAPAELAAQFAQEYAPNQNPSLGPLTATIGGEETPLDAIPSGARVTLRVGWSDSEAEHFTYFDRDSQTLVTRHETLRVAWYADAGTLAEQSPPVVEPETALEVENVWLAPRTAREAQLWFVLRDSRGGVGFARYTLGVRSD